MQHKHRSRWINAMTPGTVRRVCGADDNTGVDDSSVQKSSRSSQDHNGAPAMPVTEPYDEPRSLERITSRQQQQQASTPTTNSWSLLSLPTPLPITTPSTSTSARSRPATPMSIKLYIGHSGQTLELDPSITTLESLRAFITQHASIQPRSQVLLTGHGKQVRQQTLLTESELFVFDLRFFSGKDAGSSSGPELEEGVGPYEAGKAPDTIANQNDLSAWQGLFRLRRSWAEALLGGCSRVAKQADQYSNEEAVIARSLGAAVASLQQHLRTGEKKLDGTVKWVDEVLQEQGEHLQGWERNLDSLRSVPAKGEFVRFVQATSPTTRRSSQQGTVTTLQGFVDVARTRRAAGSAKRVADDLNRRLDDLHSKLGSSNKQTEELLQAVEHMNNDVPSNLDVESEPAQLRTEIEIIVSKMASDLAHVQSLPRTSQSVSQASKMALLHTRNYLPNLLEYCTEMNELLSRHQQRKESVAAAAHEHMGVLAAIESQLATLYSAVDSFTLPEEATQEVATLSTVARLPSVYGQLLVESVRRREWVAKMRRDTATLQEEVATYQEEEEKRRRKWMRSVEDVVNPEAFQSTRALGIELSLQNEGNSWPMVTRDELQDYVNILLQVYGSGPVVDDMEQAIKDLDKPTRKQIKHAKAFKNGSMHEAAFGDTSLLLRGDEQYKSLKDSNSRLEEEVKGQKSRVRKLEDLLHRSTQFNRSNTGDMFAQHASMERNVNSPGLPSPLPSGELSRNNSLKYRRLSSTQAIEEKRLARRVVDLEAEIQASKDEAGEAKKLASRIADLEVELRAAKDEAVSRKNSDAEVQKQAEEAILTKKDLMENMEAQQREFGTERRALEAELREAREKLDEAEAEIERMAGSREDERAGLDGRVIALEEEVLHFRNDAAGHAARAANEHDARAGLEKRLDVVMNAKSELDSQVRQTQAAEEARRSAEAEHVRRLASAHGYLSPDHAAPEELDGLVAALDSLAQKSAAHAKDLAEAVAFARSETDTLRTTNASQNSELVSTKQKKSATEEQVRQLQEHMSAEEAKVKSLEEQLKDEKEQLQSLRGKFADGETGSDALRQRVEEEETKVGRLSSELAEAQSHASSRETELVRLRENAQHSAATAEASSNRLRLKSERAKDVSQRLYTQNARLARLLERLGLAITYQEDGMYIEKMSKLSASVNMSDNPHSQMLRTTSLASPPPTRKPSAAADEPLDLSLVHWPEAPTAEDESAQFMAFLDQVAKFDIDVVSEAVFKRTRDYEHTARKYGRDLKESTRRTDAYKERAQRLKSEAHGKLAVNGFKEGDLALFLPTRGQAKGAWAAFNIGCPHYFLAEREGMRLGSRDFIVARISKVEQKVVDLSKSLPAADGRSLDERSEAQSFDDDNPFELSDGLTWWMVHASEERGSGAGAAPTTPGLGKSTVAAANVDAKGSLRVKGVGKGTMDDASRHLNKSLDSRRSSSASKKGGVSALVGSPKMGADGAGSLKQRSGSQASLRPAPRDAGVPSSGLGIVEASSPPAREQVAPAVRQPSASAPAQQHPEARTSSISPSKARLRSQSPSKSIRSLQRHLTRERSNGEQPQVSSPSKVTVSPSKQTQPGKQGWESIWSAEFSLESPSKKGEA